MGMELFKVLDEDGYAIYGGRGRWTPGRWRTVSGPLVPCENGLHLAALDQLPDWIKSAISIWRAEVHPSSEIIHCEDKVVVRKARVTERLSWDDQTARLFAADCAANVLGIFEAARPGDDRPRRAIEAARAFARGEIGAEELEKARDDARDAAWAARCAPQDATEGVARYAAYAAAAAAAEYTVYGAAWYAGEAAGWAAWRAARWSREADQAARASERSWQAERLAYYLRLP